jgi:general secretion pathway protein G
MRQHRYQRQRRRPRGFTLIELLVVLAVMGLLLSLVAPRYTEHVDRSRETVLRHNLRATREALDKFHADRARYPASLQELVQQHYLRALPVDPITDRADTWVLVPPQGKQSDEAVFDLRSGAPGVTREGVPYGAL